MRALIYLRVSTKEQAEKDLTEEGFSIPAQREACGRHIESLGGEVVGEYVDRGESARSARRPQLQAMLARIAEERDVDAVVVHKVDRLARNLEDHVAIQGALRRCGVRLISVTENLEESASGKLVEGIHALMAEFYSANLSSEIKKGLNQKAKMGGWPHKAPIGYKNIRETIGGRQVAHIAPDPERGPLVTAAFELYATGNWTLEKLHAELVHRGMKGQNCNKGISLSTLARTLANKVYVGTVEWNGVESQGLHEPLIDRETFDKVQALLAARAVRGTRERKHNHYLKGSLSCGVCGRRLCTQLSKGKYLYFFCLGQKDRRQGTGCRERYVSADVLESHVEAFYDRIQLPESWLEQLRELIAEEIDNRQQRTNNEGKVLEKRKATAEAEKHKLMDAYYAGAIDVEMLKSEQNRIGEELRGIASALARIEESGREWLATLERAMALAVECGKAYRIASDRGRRMLNRAIIKYIHIRDGKIAEVEYHQPFDLLFSAPEFEYVRQVGLMSHHKNTKPLVTGAGITLAEPNTVSQGANAASLWSLKPRYAVYQS